MIRVVTMATLAMVVGLLVGCHDPAAVPGLEKSETTAEQGSGPGGNFSYTVTAVPSASTITVGASLYFTVTVTQNGVPVKGVLVGVDDPIREVCTSAGYTNSQGKVTYTVENAWPALYDCKVAKFLFTFYAGGSSGTSLIKVIPVSPSGVNSLKVNNSSSSTYKVNLTVNGQNRGTTSIAPHTNVSLLSQSGFGSSTVVATVMNSGGTTLWKATLTHAPTNASQSSSRQNPHYSNYWAKSSVRLDGTTRTRAFSGVGTVYTDYGSVKKSVGGYTVTSSDAAKYGPSTSSAFGFNGPGVNWFLGLQYSCSVSCGISAGVELCFGGGAGWDIGPVSVGCNAGCCVTVASVSANLFDMGASEGAGWSN